MTPTLIALTAAALAAHTHWHTRRQLRRAEDTANFRWHTAQLAARHNHPTNPQQVHP